MSDTPKTDRLDANWAKPRGLAFEDALHVVRELERALAASAPIKSVALPMPGILTIRLGEALDKAITHYSRHGERAPEAWISARADYVKWRDEHPTNTPTERKDAPAVCGWTSDDDGTYHTGCGHAFVLNDGTPTENSMRFCCYCGKPAETTESAAMPSEGHSNDN